MQLRCYRCSWSFAIGKDELEFALKSVKDAGGNHYDVRCPRCRHANRLSLEQLERAAPRTPTQGPEEESANPQ
jgi:phage FluMu protein Com